MILRNLNINLELEFTNDELNSNSKLNELLDKFFSSVEYTPIIPIDCNEKKNEPVVEMNCDKKENEPITKDDIGITNQVHDTNTDTVEQTEEDKIRDIERKYNPKLVREHVDYSRGDLVSIDNIKNNKDIIKVCSNFRCSNCGQATFMKVVRLNKGVAKEHYILRQVVDEKSMLIDLDYEKTKDLVEKMKNKFKYKYTDDEIKENKIIKAILKEFQKDNSYLTESDVVITYIDDKDHLVYLECPVCDEKINITDINENIAEIDYMQCDYCGSEMFIDIRDDNYICSNSKCFSNIRQAKSETKKKNKGKKENIKKGEVSPCL